MKRALTILLILLAGGCKVPKHYPAPEPPVVAEPEPAPAPAPEPVPVRAPEPPPISVPEPVMPPEPVRAPVVEVRRRVVPAKDFAPPAETTKVYDAYAGIEHPASVALGETFDIKTWIRWQHPAFPTVGDIHVNISQVHVTPLMKVAMESDQGAFTIDGPPTPIQHVPLEITGSTEWLFKLRALKSGNHKITIHFSYVSTDGGVVAPAETYDQTRIIEVQVLGWWGRVKATMYRAWNYYNTNAFFKWFMNTLGGLLSLESLRRAWSWFKKKREGVSQA